MMPTRQEELGAKENNFISRRLEYKDKPEDKRSIKMLDLDAY